MRLSFIPLIISALLISCKDPQLEVLEFDSYLQKQFEVPLDTSLSYVLINRGCPGCIQDILEDSSLYRSEFFIISGLDKKYFIQPEKVHFDTRENFYYNLEFTTKGIQVIEATSERLKIDTGISHLKALIQ